MIQSLTEMYIKTPTGSSLQEIKPYIQLSTVHKKPKKVDRDTTWSADFIRGKGEGLIFLLHGKPGVGKTYTAGEPST